MITGDDGANAPGLWHLAEVVNRSSLSVLVAAPQHPCGGIGTGIRTDDLLVVREWPRGVVSQHERMGTPALGVMAACGGLFGAPPDVIIAGINYGPNVGRLSIHSGTVGAVLTASSFRKPALAFSIDDVYSTEEEDSPPYWDTVDNVVERLVAWLVLQDRPLALNINIPNLPRRQLAGVRAAKLATRGEVFLPSSNPRLTSLGFEEADCAPDTDVALLHHGCVTVSPIECAFKWARAAVGAIASIWVV